MSNSYVPFTDDWQQYLETQHRIEQLLSRGQKGNADDSLRLAVILLHAMLEDFLRYTLFLHLPKCEAKILDRVPLAGDGDGLRLEKFFLGRLVEHKGKTVDELLAESIALRVNRRTFSSFDDLMSFCDQIGAEKEWFRAHQNELSAMMKRRHQIAHHADMVGDKIAPRVLAPISWDSVLGWARAVVLLIAQLQKFNAKIIGSLKTDDEMSVAILDALAARYPSQLVSSMNLPWQVKTGPS